MSVICYWYFLTPQWSVSTCWLLETNTGTLLHIEFNSLFTFHWVFFFLIIFFLLHYISHCLASIFCTVTVSLNFRVIDDLKILSSIQRIFRMSFNVFFRFVLELWGLRRNTIDTNYHPQHIMSRGYVINMTCHWWCEPQSPGWGSIYQVNLL